MSINDKKGINVTSGFKLVAPTPIDARFIAQDENDLQSLIDNGAVYNGLEVWVNSLSKKLRYNGTQFEEITSGGTSESPILELNTVGMDLYNLLTTDTNEIIRPATNQEKTFFTDVITRLSNGEKIGGFITALSTIRAYFQFMTSDGDHITFKTSRLSLEYNYEYTVVYRSTYTDEEILVFKQKIYPQSSESSEQEINLATLSTILSTDTITELTSADINFINTIAPNSKLVFNMAIPDSDIVINCNYYIVGHISTWVQGIPKIIMIGQHPDTQVLVRYMYLLSEDNKYYQLLEAISLTN